MDLLKEYYYHDLTLIKSPFSEDGYIYYRSEFPGISFLCSDDISIWEVKDVKEPKRRGGSSIYLEMTYGALFYNKYNEYLREIIPEDLDYVFHLKLTMSNLYFDSDIMNDEQKLLKIFNDYESWSNVVICVLIEDNDLLTVSNMNALVEKINSYSTILFGKTRYKCTAMVAKGDIDAYPAYLLSEAFNQPGIVFKHRFRDYKEKY